MIEYLVYKLKMQQFHINQINDNTEYVLTSCFSTCKRCYSASSSDCYECITGYVLVGRVCQPNTGYYLKTPPNSDEEEIKILTVIDKPAFDIEQQNPLTITIWFKYFGIILNKNVDYTNYPLFYLYRSGTVKSCFTYKPENELFILIEYASICGTSSFSIIKTND